MKLRKKVTGFAATVTIGALALTACSGGGSNEPNETNAPPTQGTSGQGTVALTIAKPDGAITAESHNPFFGESAASKYSYRMVIWEPMALINPTGDLGTTPWLAESVEWNDDYTAITAVARDGVQWSDGTDFSASDIAFTFNMFLSGDLTDVGLGVKDVSLDGNTVTISFNESRINAQARVMHTPIVPEHIWADVEDPDTDPLTGAGQVVGTGPYVLDNWTPQSVTLSANENWWGGELAVPELHYVSYTDNAGLASALMAGEADWAQAFIPQLDSTYLAADPDNHFFPAGTTGITMLYLNLQEKPFNDVAFRQALAYVIDRDSYVDIAREGASTPIWSVTGLNEEVLADEITSDYTGQNYSVDVEKARQILTDAGYTWNSNDRLVDPDGELVEFATVAPAGWSDYNSQQLLIAEEVRDALGVEVRTDQPDWGLWDESKREGTFSSIIHWIEDTGNAYGPYTSTMDPRWIDADGNAEYNFGRYDNPAVTEALGTYASTSSEEERAAALKVMQDAFVEDVPAISLGAHPLLGEFNTRNYVGWPGEDNPYASGDPTQPGVVLVLQALQVKG